MKRQHPIAFLRYTTGNFWLLIIPAVRGLLSLKGDFYSWLRGTYIDVLVLAVIIAIAVLRWRNVKFSFTDSAVNFQQGVFIKQDFSIPYSEVSAVRTIRSLHLRPFKAVRVCIETDAERFKHNSKNSCCRIIVKLKDYTEICNKITNGNNKVQWVYEATKVKLLSFCITISSTVYGIAYAAVTMIESSRIVDMQLEKRFFNAAENAVRYAEKVSNENPDGVSVYVVWAVVTAVVGWLFSFGTNYLRYVKFKTKSDRENIIIRGGFFSPWRVVLNREKINYCDVRQNLLMKICGVVTVMVSCIGYGRDRGELPVIIPAWDKKNAESVIGRLMPEFCFAETEYEAKRNGIYRYVVLPSVLIFGIISGCFFLVIFFPSWYRLIFFGGIMGLIFAVHLYAVNLTAFFTSGVGINDDVICLKYCRFYQFHSIAVPKEKVVMTEIRQSIFQKRKSACDLIIYTRCGGIKKHRVKGLDYNKIKRMMKREF